MPDMLTQVLVGYALGTALAWRYDWMRPAHVTAVMAGVLVPDLNRMELLVDSYAVETALGVPFDWGAFHTLGGVTVAILLGALLAVRGQRRRLVPLFAVGAGSHLALDAFLYSPSGRGYDVLWPLTQYHPPSPGLYMSTDPWTAAVALVVAAAVYVEDQRRRGVERPPSPTAEPEKTD